MWILLFVMFHKIVFGSFSHLVARIQDQHRQNQSDANVTTSIFVARHAIEEINDFVYLDCSVSIDGGIDLDK